MGGKSQEKRLQFGPMTAREMLRFVTHYMLLRLKGEVPFENVSFQYVDNEPALTDFSLTIRPGESLAIVGHPGAGKSLLAKLIAHRLSTVKAADRIIVIQKGRIIEEGNHDGFLEQGGHYAILNNAYFQHQSPVYVEQVREPVTK
jgi:ABC-type multidrug transport system fused ATPase/permease subunit